MYTALPSQALNKTANTTSFLAPEGVDLRSLPQMMDVNKALKIKNYIIDSDGGLEKRGGLESLLDDGGTDGIGIDVKWGDYRIYSFAKTLKAYHISTGTKTVIKNDFVDNVTDGAAYGNYFLVASPQDKIGRVTLTLDYDTQTANFATGLVLTGGTSGATAVLLEITALYTPAYLTGGTNAQGTFGTWAAVSDGSFRITIDGTAYNVDAIDFTGDASMNDVADTIQDAIRTATSSTETVVWDTDHFIISSADNTSSSEVTVTETSTGTVGTDISGAGANDWMDSDTGNGTATAKVQDIGTLTLGDITGTFTTGETITDSATGSAKVNGTLDFTYTAITAAPKARHIKVVDTRLIAGDLEPYAGNEKDSRESIRYSDVDDGANPPFDTWSIGTGATDGGRLNYRNAGNVNVIETIGSNIIVVFAEKGKWAFSIDTIANAGTLSKKDTRLMYLIDAGGTAAIQTDEGIFYVNKNGLWQLVAIAQENIKYSDQEVLTSIPLGNKFFDDKDVSNAKIVKDDKRNILLITMADDSSSNNFVLLYNTAKKAFGTITGWTGSTFLNDNGTLYMGDANSAEIWEIFSGNDDDGSDIYYEFEQELMVGSLSSRKALLGQYIQGELSPSTSPLIKFSIFDRDGVFIADKLELQWNYGSSELTATGYGEASWGDPFGGDIDSVGAVENFAGYHGRINNFQRLRINISGHDKAAHTINWFSVQTKEKKEIRRRNLTKI